MRLQGFVFVISLLQLSAAAPGESQLRNVLQSLNKKEVEELVEMLLESRIEEEEREKKPSQLDLESRKRALLEDSARLTEAVIQAERDAAANNHISGATKLLKSFVRSNNYVQRISQVAKRQLRAISMFKKDWDAAHGQNANNEEFWRVVKSNNFLSPHSCAREDTTCLSAAQRSIDYCPLDDPDCTRWDDSIYRSYDGSCNNEVDGQRAWGMANTAQLRLLDPIYEDGVSEIRSTGSSGATLPNPREVSTIINDRFVSKPATYSHMVMQYGQYLDHDITKTDAAETTDENGDAVDIYCGCDVDESSDGYEECINIEIPSDDHTSGSRTCMEVTRSAAWLEEGCANSERQQVNSITAWIDCSQVYGSDEDMAARLRDDNSTRGRLNTTEHPTNPDWKDLLPYLEADENEQDCAVDNYNCFLAGDGRRNVSPGLAAMHTAWVRFHNYIEENLYDLNPHWEGEKLFQESRRLVIAITQHITYNEYLEVILGRSRMMETNSNYGDAQLRVRDSSQQFETMYSDSVQPNIVNVFSTAAYRFGHSEITSHLKYLQEFAPQDDVDCNNVEVDRCVKYREVFNNPTTLYKSPASTDSEEVPGVDSLLLGITNDPAEKVDLWYTEEISDYLFTEEPEDESVYGYDLLALNIQRGRDHGLPGYMAYREHYGLPVSTSWDDQPDDMKDREWARLQNAYSLPEDIDVYAGGLLEKHNNGAKVGDLFKSIIAEQFLKLKIGDKFWYENEGMSSSFSRTQLLEIRKMSLSSLLCAVMDNPKYLPQNAFKLYDEDDETNPLLPCPQYDADAADGTHHEFDFSEWEDNEK